MASPFDAAAADLQLAAGLADALAAGGRRIVFEEDPGTGLPMATLLEADGSERAIALSIVIDPGALADALQAPAGPRPGSPPCMSTPEPDPTRADDPEADAWDAKLADEEQIPESDFRDPDLPGDPVEYEPPVDDEVIPGARPTETGDATEGGAGRP